MKRTKSFLVFSLATFFDFTAILYTSCKKDPCSGVTCYNGGVCDNGNCNCPSGYTGNNCELSTITFQNNSFTTVTINVNGTSATIAPNGGTTNFVGTAGSSASVTAYTNGSYGEVVNWSFADNFPTGGSLVTDPLNVSSSYFWLEITNNDFSYITTLYSNFQYSNQLVENVSIPNDGNNYGMGYYTVNSTGNSQISVDFYAGGLSTYSVFGVPYASNAYVHVIVP